MIAESFFARKKEHPNMNLRKKFFSSLFIVIFVRKFLKKSNNGKWKLNDLHKDPPPA